jgi:CRISP-associated protein Cas1
MEDYHDLPKLRDSLSYLYVEKAIIERKHHAIEYINEDGRVLIPVAALAVLMLGPGTSITHAAIRILADNGCSVIWTAAEGNNFYAQGMGETRKAYHLLHQARLASNPEQRWEVVFRMYLKRFNEKLDTSLSLPQIRGLEGVRVRSAYRQASQKYGVPWLGRKYDRKDWGGGDPINRALSAANALLNGVCHAAIVSGGYSAGIGFIHTGKQLSFVYDMADLYKTEITIPEAFETVAESTSRVERRVREACREKFRQMKLLERILIDADEMLQTSDAYVEETGDLDGDPALPTPLWEELLGDDEK